MTFNIDIAVAMIQGLGLLALISVAFGTLARVKFSAFNKSVLAGLAFGIGAVAAMLSPAEIRPGSIIDLRSVFVAAAAVFGGPIAALIAVLLAGAFRWFVVGGGGALVGTVGIVGAAFIGCLWSRFHPRSQAPTYPDLMLAGVFISAHFLCVYLFPLEVANNAMLNIFPYVLAATVLGTLLLGALTRRESDLIQREFELQAAAHTDLLTGLANRRGFENVIARRRVAAGHFDIPAVLVIIDIDHFKAVNDLHGHAAGDDVLVTFADVLRLGIRPKDFVGRIGGEEFAILFEDTSRFEAQATIERLLRKIRCTDFFVNNRQIKITASAGMAEFFGEDDNIDAALANADEALYTAKHNGRDQLHFAKTFAEAGVRPTAANLR